jgi:hypothetical protein
MSKINFKTSHAADHGLVGKITFLDDCTKKQKTPDPVGIMIDLSCSMNPWLKDIKAAVKSILPHVSDGTSLYIGCFATGAMDIFGPVKANASTREEAARMVDAITIDYRFFGLSTNLSAGLELVMKNVPSGVHIVITDGEPNAGDLNVRDLERHATFSEEAKGYTALAQLNPIGQGMYLLTQLANRLKTRDPRNEAFYCSGTDAMDSTLSRIALSFSGYAVGSDELVVILEDAHGRKICDNLYVPHSYGTTCNEVYVSIPKSVVEKHGSASICAVVYEASSGLTIFGPENVAPSTNTEVVPVGTATAIANICGAVDLMTIKQEALDNDEIGVDDYVDVAQEFECAYRSVSAAMNVIGDVPMAKMVAHDVSRWLEYATTASFKSTKSKACYAIQNNGLPSSYSLTQQADDTYDNPITYRSGLSSYGGDNGNAVAYRSLGNSLTQQAGDTYDNPTTYRSGLSSYGGDNGNAVAYRSLGSNGEPNLCDGGDMAAKTMVIAQMRASLPRMARRSDYALHINKKQATSA